MGHPVGTSPGSDIRAEIPSWTTPEMATTGTGGTTGKPTRRHRQALGSGTTEVRRVRCDQLETGRQIHDHRRVSAGASTRPRDSSPGRRTVARSAQEHNRPAQRRPEIFESYLDSGEFLGVGVETHATGSVLAEHDERGRDWHRRHRPHAADVTARTTHLRSYVDGTLEIVPGCDRLDRRPGSRSAGIGPPPNVLDRDVAASPRRLGPHRRRGRRLGADHRLLLGLTEEMEPMTYIYTPDCTTIARRYRDLPAKHWEQTSADPPAGVYHDLAPGNAETFGYYQLVEVAQPDADHIRTVENVGPAWIH